MEIATPLPKKAIIIIIIECLRQMLLTGACQRLVLSAASFPVKAICAKSRGNDSEKKDKQTSCSSKRVFDWNCHRMP